MHLNNTLAEYGFFSKVLHWLSAILLFIQIPLGFYLVDLDFGEERLTFENIHIILGLTIYHWILNKMISTNLLGGYLVDGLPPVARSNIQFGSDNFFFQDISMLRMPWCKPNLHLEARHTT